MPVQATPVAGDPVSCPPPANPTHPVAPNPVTTCCTQNEVFPTMPTFQGQDIRGRIASVTVQANQSAVIRWQMLDQSGNPLSLAGCFTEPPVDSESSSESVSASSESAAWVEGTMPGTCNDNFDVLFSMREQLSVTKTTLDTEVTVESVTDGIVRVELPATCLQRAGVYFGEFGIYDRTDALNPVRHYSNLFYIYVEPQISLDQLNGTPSFAEVRLFLRDSAPVENLLLDALKFSDSEIVLAIRLPVQEWNETPPPIQTYNTINFPFRMNWLNAICGYLFRMAAEQYRSNRLPVSAGGVQVDDQGKEDNYERAAAIRLQEWRQFIRVKKSSMNLEQGYGGIGSDYGQRGASRSGY